MPTFWNDLRYGLRGLRKNPRFAAIGVATLALAIGATTAVFSVVNAVLLRAFPYKDPERLVMVWERNPALGEPMPGSRVQAARKNLDEWKRQNHVFEGMAAFRELNLNLSGLDKPEQVKAAAATPDFFSLLGVQTRIGRAFRADDRQAAVLTDAFFQKHFAGNPACLGRVLTFDGAPYTIIGVLPPRFYLPALWEGMDQIKPEVWIPLPLLKPQEELQRRLLVPARLKPGVSLAQARAEMVTIARRLAQADPRLDAGWSVNVFPLHVEDTTPGLRRALYILLGAVAFVLLIGCANLANLTLARAVGRQKEMAIRLAMGASWARLMAYLLSESLVMAMAGGVGGLLLAHWGIRLIAALEPGEIHHLEQVRIDVPVALFAVAVSLATTLLVGLLPALVAARTGVHAGLKQGGGKSAAGGIGPAARKFLVAGEVALALVLSIGAGLMIQSFAQVLAVDPGFRPDHLLTMRLTLPESRYAKAEQRAAFGQRLLESVRALPGVRSASLVDYLPLESIAMMQFRVVGRPTPQPGSEPRSDYATVTPEFFRTMGMSLKAGRLFTEADRERDAKTGFVALANESFARRLFDGNAVGRQLEGGTGITTIVGVVSDYHQLSIDTETRPQLFWPVKQLRDMALVVRTTTEPLSLSRAIQQQVWNIDPEQPVFQIQTGEALIKDSVSQRRFNMILLGVFAGLALIIAAVGIYGVLSCIVASRTQEIGIRMALGAEPRAVERLMLGQTARIVGAGIASGLAASLVLGRVLASLLFHVSAYDPLAIGGSALFLGAIAMLASYLPVRRAMKVDPMVALRDE